MSYFIRSGGKYFVQSHKSLDITEKLHPAIYIVKEDIINGMFLEETESFVLPEKLYGDTESNAKIILNTYKDRKVSTGCLFVGEKGSGKTLLAKHIAQEAIKLNIPTIIVNSPFSGNKFNQIIQNISQECIVLFDEFEKVYNEKEDQSQILTLLDGSVSTKKLFLFTCNNKHEINSYMINRPGRIYYMLEFDSVEEQFVRDYCQDNLNNKEEISSIVNISSMFLSFNFDMLQNLVEEMNRYDKSAIEAIKMLNMKPESIDSCYKIDYVKINGEKIECNTSTVYGEPFSSTYSIDCSYTANAIEKKFSKRKTTDEDIDLDEDSYDRFTIDFSPDDMMSMNLKKGEYCYELQHDSKMIEIKIINRNKKKNINYFKFF